MFKLSAYQRRFRACLGLFLALFILAGSCSLINSNRLTATQCNKIAIFLPETGAAQRWEGSDRPALERGIAKKLKDHVNEDLMLLYFNANGNSEKQKEQAKLAFDQNVCLLIIGPSGKSAIEIVRDATQRGIPVIAYDRVIDDKQNTYAPYYISFDSQLVGKYQGEYIAKELGKGNSSKYQFQNQNNKYVMINGDQDDNNTTLLRQGFEESLNSYINNGTIKYIEKPYNQPLYIEDWDGRTAANKVVEILNKNPDLKIAWVANDNMANHIIGKLGDRKGKILITGQDGTIQSLKNIKDKSQSMTVCKDSQDIAERTASLVEALFNDEDQKISQLLPDKVDYTKSQAYVSKKVYSVREDNFEYRVSRDKKDNILLENTCKGISKTDISTQEPSSKQ
ncbi:substrate-binding domain-containing protein [Planktothrix mougeotii]|uniref:Substrate-binding domain-containing protein n=1 Tax=Planktothrix mougeotii LEGE 06226 TaxID=1828728 RepID=A0ABR9U9M8_9CYAN|nr:substrate-binding domain-containing protein [Planktothrix mougeotii]MBE9143135.1 substrate-binding domain-containing protein [Planktothrix mougeotii LEGE 06226]